MNKAITTIHVVTCTHIWVLIVIIIIAGLLGGIVNYFMNNVTKSIDRYDFIKSLFLGLVASAIIPLFLETISSSLIYESQQEHLKYFVFGGFCLLASIFSSKFLQSLADRILKELNEVKSESKDNKEKVDAMVSQKSDDKQTEEFIDTKLKAGNDMEIVLISLQNEEYTFRTITGIVNECNITESAAKVILRQLEEKNYAKRFYRSDGVTLWALTPQGQRISLLKE
jgi:fluoride ion exporter CrcB/FEX/predicted transcriptional regulator